MKSLLITALFLSFISTSHSQHYFYNEQYLEPTLVLEASWMAGGMNALTDLGGKRMRNTFLFKDINFSQTHICNAVFFQVAAHSGLSFRLQAMLGNISAADSLSHSDEALASFRIRRNLHFRSRIAEWQGLFCWEPLITLADHAAALSPYLMAGVGIFRFNPKAVWENRWVALQPLRTEGQGFDEYPERRVYKLTQVQFPVGIGIRYEISARIVLRIECIYRFLNTDYLDDVSTSYITPISFSRNLDPQTAELARRLSDRRYRGNDGPVSPNAQRGNPLNNDSYFSVTSGVGFVLNRRKR